MKPTCWYHPVSGRVRFDGDSLGPSWIPLYKHHEWVGLTDEEIVQAMYKADAIVTGATQINFARAIEAKLKEKNASS